MSGLGVSLINLGVLWTINDHGGKPEVYAVRYTTSKKVKTNFLDPFVKSYVNLYIVRFPIDISNFEYLQAFHSFYFVLNA